jgi:hypothetical protein
MLKHHLCMEAVPWHYGGCSAGQTMAIRRVMRAWQVRNMSRVIQTLDSRDLSQDRRAALNYYLRVRAPS